MSFTVHINSLPDLVLRRIFSKVPLLDLLYADRVCPLWKNYQVETGKQVRSLSLLIGPPDTHHLITKSCFTLKYRDLLLNDDGTRMYSSQYLHKHYHLTFDSFNLDCATKLLNIFPHITSFEIAIKCYRGHFRLLPMVPLLTQWSVVLKSLKMYFKFNGDYFESFYAEESNEVVNLLEVINSMQLLEHLTLDTDTEINLGKSFNLPILGHLREFFFKSNDEFDFIEKSLQRYALPNDNLKQIGLHFKMIENSYSRLLQLASKIVYLPLDVSEFRSPQVRHILQSFSSITKLDLLTLCNNNDNLTNATLNFIATLPQLVHLHLKAYYPVFLTPTQISPNLLPKLSSVQVLTIVNMVESTSVFESNYWAHLFPNVQVIELAIRSAKCLPFLSKQQLRKILSPFVQCPKLHHLYTCEKYSPYLSNIEHTLPEMFKEWILLHVRDRKIIIQIEK